MKQVFTIIICFLGFSLHAQLRIPKQTIGLDVEASHLFPNYLNTNTNWHGSFYPSGNISVSYNHRINYQWQSMIGIGLQGFGLINEGAYDKYTFDFVSPHAFLGFQYFIPTNKKYDGIIRGTMGTNFTPIQPFKENFPNYSVNVFPNRLLNPYLKASVGLSNQFKRKVGNQKNRLIWEVGVSYTYQPFPFGYATFLDKTGSTIAAPTGSGFGLHFKIYFPVGNDKVSAKRKKIKGLKTKKSHLKTSKKYSKTARHL